jgi:hypothetical protein
MFRSCVLPLTIVAQPDENTAAATTKTAATCLKRIINPPLLMPKCDRVRHLPPAAQQRTATNRRSPIKLPMLF